jgi:hypothetical protein
MLIDHKVLIDYLPNFITRYSLAPVARKPKPPPPTEWKIWNGKIRIPVILLLHDAIIVVIVLALNMIILLFSKLVEFVGMPTWFTHYLETIGLIFALCGGTLAVIDSIFQDGSQPLDNISWIDVQFRDTQPQYFGGAIRLRNVSFKGLNKEMISFRLPPDLAKLILDADGKPINYVLEPARWWGAWAVWEGGYSGYCNFANSAFACFRMGMSGSASFQSVRKSK